MKAKGDVEGLIKALSDYLTNDRVRQAAADALGQIGDARAVAPLIAALGDRSGDVRATAAGALAKIGTPAVPPLIALLGGRGGLGYIAADALAKIGTPAVEPLIAALKHSEHGEYDVRKDLAWALGKIGDARAVAPLIAALKDRYDSVRDAALAALVQIGTSSVQPLTAALRDTDRSVRERAARALATIGWQPGQNETGAIFWVLRERWDKCVEIGTVAVAPLLSAVKTGDRDVPEKAAEALDKIGWRPGRDERGAAYWLDRGRWDKCIEIGAPAVGPLIAALDVSRNVSCKRQEAASALGQIGDARAVEPLIAALNDSKSDVRLAAADALAKIGDARAVQPLIAALYTTHGAAEALVKIGTPAVEPLIAALKMPRRTMKEWLMRDVDFRVHREALAALVEIGTPAVEPLIAALKHSESDVRKAAVHALQEIGDARAVEPLIATLKDTDSDVCFLARGALEKMDWRPGHDEHR